MNQDKYLVYLQMPKDIPRKCFHSFSVKEKAIKYANLGAKACKAVVIIVENFSGKEIYRADHRVN